MCEAVFTPKGHCTDNSGGSIRIRRILIHSWSAESKNKVGWVINRKLHENNFGEMHRKKG